MKKVQLLSLLGICVVLLSACSSTPTVVGRWDAVLPPTPTPLPTPTSDPNAGPLDVLADIVGIMTDPTDIQMGCETIYPTSVEFFKDGTFTSGQGGFFSGRYEILEGKRLKFETAAGITAFDLILSGSTLSIRYDDQCTLTYQRAR